MAMDTSLINLIPNLLASRRSATVPRSPFIDPPPPYTLASSSSPQRQYNASSHGIPLAIEFLDSTNPNEPHKREVIYRRDDTVALGPDTDYWEFMHILRRKLADVNVSGDDGRWKVGVCAEGRGRAVWRLRKTVLAVTRESWGEVLRGLEEHKYSGLKVACWREEDEDVKYSGRAGSAKLGMI